MRAMYPDHIACCWFDSVLCYVPPLNGCFKRIQVQTVYWQISLGSHQNVSQVVFRLSSWCILRFDHRFQSTCGNLLCFHDFLSGRYLLWTSWLPVPSCRSFLCFVLRQCFPMRGNNICWVFSLDSNCRILCKRKALFQKLGTRIKNARCSQLISDTWAANSQFTVLWLLCLSVVIRRLLDCISIVIGCKSTGTGSWNNWFPLK